MGFELQVKHARILILRYYIRYAEIQDQVSDENSIHRYRAYQTSYSITTGDQCQLENKVRTFIIDSILFYCDVDSPLFYASYACKRSALQQHVTRTNSRGTCP